MHIIKNPRGTKAYAVKSLLTTLSLVPHLAGNQGHHLLSIFLEITHPHLILSHLLSFFKFFLKIF